MKLKQKLCKHDFDFYRIAEASGGFMTERRLRVALKCNKCGKVEVKTVIVRPRGGAVL